MFSLTTLVLLQTAKAQDFKQFFEYYSIGCRGQQLNQLGLTLNDADQVSNDHLNVMVKECNQRLLRAQRALMSNGAREKKKAPAGEIALNREKHHSFILVQFGRQ